jgi:hypothetical protein
MTKIWKKYSRKKYPFLSKIYLSLGLHINSAGPDPESIKSTTQLRVVQLQSSLLLLQSALQLQWIYLAFKSGII